MASHLSPTSNAHPLLLSYAHHVSGDIERKLDSAEARGGESEKATQVMREIAERQHGVVARRQLVEHGLSSELIRGRLESGRLIPIHQGVFALGHLRIGRRGEWMAAVLACGPGAVLSHGSAAELWSIRGSRGKPEVTRRSGGTRRHGVRLHQTRMLDKAERTLEAGIPVTSIERTLLDMAARLDARQIERAVVAADRSGRLRWPELARLLDRTPRRPGAGRLRRVARDVDPRAVEAISPGEVDFLALCREAELPLPQVNVRIEGFLVDFLWPAQRLVVEADSYGYHGDRPAFERDHHRTAALTAAGYEVHRATYRMLQRDPDLVFGNVRRALDRRRASRTGAISTQT